MPHIRKAIAKLRLEWVKRRQHISGQRNGLGFVFMVELDKPHLFKATVSSLSQRFTDPLLL